MARSQSGTATVELDDKQTPAPKRVMKAVFGTLRSRGYDVMTVADLEAPEHSEVNGGLTPAFANDARKLDNAGVFSHMDLTDELEGVFGEPSGSSHVTTVFVRAGETVAETVAKLDKRGHIEAAIDKAVAEESPEGIDLTESQKEQVAERATDMVAYKLAEFAKGWVAEKTITATGAFSKASMSNDIGEQDAYAKGRGRYEQVKSVTLGYKPNGTVVKSDRADATFETAKKGVPVVFYQWDCNGHIVVGTDHKEVNKVAADAKGERATTIARTHRAYTYDGRTYRKLWW